MRVIHALKDEEIDYEKSLQFMEQAETSDADVIVRKQGNHRLMKPRDLTLLTYTIHRLLQHLELEQERAKSKI